MKNLNTAIIDTMNTTNIAAIINTSTNNLNGKVERGLLMENLHRLAWSDLCLMAKEADVSLALKKGESRTTIEDRIADAVIAKVEGIEPETKPETKKEENSLTTATTAVKKAVLVAWGDDTFVKKDGDFVAREKGDGYALFFRATIGQHKGTIISTKNMVERATVRGICQGLNKKGLNSAVVNKYIRRAVSIMMDSGYCHVYQGKKDWFVHMNNQELKKFWEDYKEVKTSK